MLERMQMNTSRSLIRSFSAILRDNHNSRLSEYDTVPYSLSRLTLSFECDTQKRTLVVLKGNSQNSRTGMCMVLPDIKKLIVFEAVFHRFHLKFNHLLPLMTNVK